MQTAWPRTACDGKLLSSQVNLTSIVIDGRPFDIAGGLLNMYIIFSRHIVIHIQDDDQLKHHFYGY